ncbi:MAG: ferritin-like domain-containing protein [Elainella sp.]
MNLLTQALHLLGSGATAYITARNLRDPQTRPDLLAGFQLAESGSVPFLETLAQRASREGDAWLAEQLSRHAQDERRHGQIFAHALKQLNKQVIDFRAAASSERSGHQAASDQSASQQPAQQPAQSPSGQSGSAKPPERRSPFFEAYYAGYSRADLMPETMDWTVFFFSTHILELDASKDFLRMASVLPNDAASLNLQKGLISIASDEQRHAAYLLEAASRRLPAAQVTALVDEWRERKVNALLAMVSNLLGKGGAMPSLARDGVPDELSVEVSEVGSLAA